MKIDTRTMHTAKPDPAGAARSRLTWLLIGILIGSILALFVERHFQ
ncbi:hypothetical protein [uncultured Sphingomonas sp.]|nr:hypothetical protein [uncultured Sphingomonas sp.]